MAGFLKNVAVSPWNLYDTVKATVRLSLGRLEGEWEHSLFPPEATQKRRQLFNWSRFLLVGHGLILAVAIVFDWWLLPVLTTFAPFYGGGLRYLCNNLQHAGLQDNVPNFRLCCRTVILNSFTSFLYWQRNYHTEHHMYAGVPCYNLPRLHRLIEHEMPECKRAAAACLDRDHRHHAQTEVRPCLPARARPAQAYPGSNLKSAARHAQATTRNNMTLTSQPRKPFPPGEPQCRNAPFM